MKSSLLCVWLLLYCLVCSNAWMSIVQTTFHVTCRNRIRDLVGGSGRLHLHMQQKKSGGVSGGTQLDIKQKQSTAPKSSLKNEIEKEWRLILHDDTVHTIQEVCEIIGSRCPLCPPARAYEVTLETHMTGAGTIAVSNKKVIDEYTRSLQKAGLTVSMSPDDDFEPVDGDDDEDGDDVADKDADNR